MMKQTDATVHFPNHAKKMLWLLCLFMLTLIAGCVQRATPDPSPSATVAVQAPTSTAGATTTSTPIFTSTPIATLTQPSIPQDTSTRTRYTLTAELDYPTHRLAVDETIRYTNRSADILSELVLVVEPDLNDGEFQMKSDVLIDDKPVVGSTLDGEKLVLPLLAPLAPGESVELKLTYTLDLPATPGVLSFDARQDRKSVV